MTDVASDDARVRPVAKSATAFRTISEVSTELEVPQHVLRFWETKFPQIKPLKRGGGRRYYRPDDVELLRRIQALLYREGYTIRGVQRLLKEAKANGGELPPVGEAPPLSLAPGSDGEGAIPEDEIGAEDEPESAADMAQSDEGEDGDAPTAEGDNLSPELRELLSDTLMDLLAARRLLD
ncbi:MerR family transcriptional regulator [Niveispirillum irakense]|uniref:MerR family transcriptional regulator n=1 Tax=Niveispirillum irakense TaxID=34011 RepID=UPI000416982F|nr:MerR family transcriptional regulator [Niveispirillum irakense]